LDDESAVWIASMIPEKAIDSQLLCGCPWAYPDHRAAVGESLSICSQFLRRQVKEFHPRGKHDVSTNFVVVMLLKPYCCIFKNLIQDQFK
jgi:hypothetical protein